MNYLVTGGTGFIGSHLVSAIAEKGNCAIVLYRNKSKFKQCDNIINVSGDVTNLSSLQTIFREYDIDGVFHLAAMGNANLSFSNPKLFNDVNITGTLNLLLAAREASVNNFVFSSSALVYGKIDTTIVNESCRLNPLTPYAVSKAAGEMYCKLFSDQFGINTSILRYFNVYGPGQDSTAEFAAVIPKFIDKIIHHESPIIFGTGEQCRDFIFVRDVVSANLLAMNSSVSGIYNIGSGKPTSLNDIVNMIKDITGIDSEIIYKNSRGYEIDTVAADISHARLKIDYSPSYTIYNGLQDTINYFLEK